MFWGIPSNTDVNWLCNQLHNHIIERPSISHDGPAIIGFPERPEVIYQPPANINLNVADEELLKISEEGLLALNLEEMKAIQKQYNDPTIQETRQSYGITPDAPTDVELECLAQTWSEHCSHKIFAAKIHHIDTETGEDSTINSLFKTHIMKPTFEIKKSADWLVSLFNDNS